MMSKLMKDTETDQSHIHRLQELGFPKIAVDEGARAAERNLFDLEPSPDLVARIIERCGGTKLQNS